MKSFRPSSIEEGLEEVCKGEWNGFMMCTVLATVLVLSDENVWIFVQDTGVPII